jgi:putative membrane protein
MRKLNLILAATAMSLPALPAAAAPAGVFLTDAIKGNNAEVAVGRLAQRRGASNAVRDFGRTLARDHSAANVQAMAVARRERVRIPSGVKPDAAALQRRLSRLSGPAFDREFAQAMVVEHQQDIAKFEAQVRTGDRLTSNLARDTLPHLRHHLEIAQDLAADRGRGRR